MNKRIKKKFFKSSEKRYYSKKLKAIRKILETNTKLPSYNPSKWKKRKVNCYAYALDIPIDDPLKRIWIPGQMCTSSFDYQLLTDVSGHVKKDLDFLKISYRENSETLNPGEYRIAIYYSPTFYDWPIGFHISRQDSNGIWSEKTSWTGKIQKFDSPSDTPPDLSKHKLYLEEILILKK